MSWGREGRQGHMSKKKKIFSYLLLFAMIAVTLVVLLRSFEIQDVFSVLMQAKYEWLFLGCLLIFLYIACEGESMRLICRTIGVNYSVPRGFVYAAIDIYFCAVTPSATGGAPLMMVYMSKDDIPYTKSSVMVLLNSVMYTLAMVVLVVISLILCPFILREDHLFFRICLGIGIFCSIGLITLCLLGIFRESLVERMARKVIRLLSKLHLVRHAEALEAKLTDTFYEYKQAARILRGHPLVMLWAFLLNLAQRASYYAVAFVAYLALGGTDLATLLPLFAIQAVTSIAVYSIPLPGAMGASEAMLLILYKMVFPEEDERVAALLLTRGISFYLNVIFCAVVTVVHHLRITYKKSPHDL